MLIRTGTGSLSLVAGCCWVNSVAQAPSPAREAQAPMHPPAEEPGKGGAPVVQNRGGSSR